MRSADHPPDNLEQIAARVADELADASPEDVHSAGLRGRSATVFVQHPRCADRRGEMVRAFAWAVRPGIDVIFLDTGYHFAETMGTRDAVAAVYPVNLISVAPDTNGAPDRTQTSVLNCTGATPTCAVLPPEEVENPGARPRAATTRGSPGCGSQGVGRWSVAEIAAVEWDQVRRKMVKVNPMVSWVQEQVDDYVAENGRVVRRIRWFTTDTCRSAARHAAARGVVPGEDPRSGRWAAHGEDQMPASTCEAVIPRKVLQQQEFAPNNRPWMGIVVGEQLKGMEGEGA